MGQLKAGKYHVQWADSMAAEISKAMDEEWQHRKGTPLGDVGREDREILFIAIARGVLGYLKRKQAQLDTTNADDHTHNLVFNVVDP